MKIASVEFIVRGASSPFVFGIEYPVATEDEALACLKRDQANCEVYRNVVILDTRYHLDLRASQPQV